MDIKALLTEAVRQKASDVHLKMGAPPMVRVRGNLQPIHSNLAPLTKEDLNAICKQLFTSKGMAEFQENKEVDIAYSISKVGRFRANIFQQRGSIAIVIRNIPYQIPKLKDLHLPNVIEGLTDLDRGLVLFTGETGSGKSTSLASFVDRINDKYSKHIVTIEDPIEYLIPDNKSIITQREVGVDTRGFQSALRASLRQDPDVILIGELRDAETIRTALMAAETGHLVISTLHTTDTRETILRILSYFQAHQQSQLQFQLASSLKAVISQRLLMRKDKKGFVPAVEVLINNQRVSESIMDLEKLIDLGDVLEESHITYGMQSFDQSLAALIKEGLIDEATALKAASKPNDFALKLKGVYSLSRSDSFGDLGDRSDSEKEKSIMHDLHLETLVKKKKKA